jgi:DNA-binding NarL/FixJ family response regulator
MPKLNGADVLAELRRLKPKQMVLMSSAYDRAIILSRLNAGLKPSSFIQKPYEFDDLLVVINSTFGEQTC